MIIIETREEELGFKIAKTKEGLYFDTNDQECKIKIEQSQGKLFAFIECKNNLGHIKKYWGLYSHNNPKKYILEIMRTGGKWENPIN